MMQQDQSDVLRDPRIFRKKTKMAEKAHELGLNSPKQAENNKNA